jgi:hypothetical protein
MTDAEILEKVKKGLGITTDYQDETLSVYIITVKDFMRGAGVSEEVLTSPAAVGCILLGVNDLWNYGSGDVKFSKVFEMRLIQLTKEG